jgi:tRNA uridine 5-carbamoylmethylation protein Kti12
LKIINLFGGPCTGKSTVAAGLFFLMKTQDYSVELVHEYAKELAWENRMESQDFISAMQNRRLERLQGKVDYVITDSPLLLGLNYGHTLESFRKYQLDCFLNYNNFLNIFLVRDDLKYKQTGRFETLQEAKLMDTKILAAIEKAKLEFIFLKSDIKTPEFILNALKEIECQNQYQMIK